MSIDKLRKTGIPGEMITDSRRKEEMESNRKVLKDNPKLGKVKKAVKAIGYGLLGRERLYGEEESMRDKKRRDAKGRLKELKSNGGLRG